MSTNQRKHEYVYFCSFVYDSGRGHKHFCNGILVWQKWIDISADILEVEGFLRSDKDLDRSTCWGLGGLVILSLSFLKKRPVTQESPVFNGSGRGLTMYTE